MGETSNRAASCTIVCVHGAGGGGWEWAIWARVLAARGYSVLAPDLQHAAGGIAATRYVDYRDQVLHWCRGIAAPLVLIGASLGGSLALAAAALVDVAALVLINPLVPHDGAPSESRQPRPASIPWARERSLAGTRRAMADADDAACLYALRRWRDESGAVLDEAEATAFASPSCPLLVLASGLDRDVPPAASRALAARLDADFLQIAGAGHLGPLLGRAAASVAERTAEWLEPRQIAR